MGVCRTAVCSPSPSACSCGTSVSSAREVGGETREAAGLDDTESALISLAITGSVWKAGGEAYEV